MQLQRGNMACSTRPCQAAATFKRPLLRRRVVSSVVTTPASTNGGWDASPGGYETSWYAWPEGYLGQGFNLLGKMEPRATGLADDLSKRLQAPEPASPIFGAFFAYELARRLSYFLRHEQGECMHSHAHSY